MCFDVEVAYRNGGWLEIEVVAVVAVELVSLEGQLARWDKDLGNLDPDLAATIAETLKTHSYGELTAACAVAEEDRERDKRMRRRNERTNG
jgi:hypothetical protein